MAFRLAHFSDPHLNPLPRVRLRELAGKRLTGFANYMRSRRHAHDMGVLERIVADIQAQRPDHIACTGDVAHIGLEPEFEHAARFLDRLGSRDHVSFVPGNHDVYVPASLGPLTAATLPWCRSDDGAGGYPWLKVRGGVALVGLSSAVPTGPFMAWGRAGADQLDKAEMLLRYAGKRGLRRVVLIHHPPHRHGAKQGRELKDAAAFEAMIAAAGAELILHGHNHRTSLAWMPAPDGNQAPVVGVACASMGPAGHGEKAAWHLFDIPEDGPITVTRRGLAPDGTLGALAQTVLRPPGVSAS